MTSLFNIACNESFEEITEQITLLESVLTLNQIKFQKEQSTLDEFKKNDSLVLSGENLLNQDKQIEKFEKFMNDAVKQTVDKVIDNSNKKKQKNKKRKYVPKHLGPFNVLNHHGVNLMTIFGRIQEIGCSVQVILYDKVFLREKQNKLIDPVLYKLLQKTFDRNIECQPIFRHSITTGLSLKSCWVYFYPKPKYQTQPLYSKSAMKAMVENLFDKFLEFRVKNIGFEEFTWPGLDQEQTCYLFFMTVIKYLTQNACYENFKFQLIRVFCSQKKYLLFSKILKDIADEYVKTGYVK